MEIKILSPEEVEFKEKDVQNAFERNVSKLEEGLELVGSEVVIGTGRIDTLAFDTNTNRPVFIEYKRRGEFSKDALIQLMDYLSWFARDENRMAVLEKVIRQRKPEIEDIEPSIRLICVVTDIDDRIKNAIYVISNHVKVFSYMVARDTSNNVVLVPKLEVDNYEVEPQMRQLVSESEVLKKHPHLQEALNNLRTYLENDGTVSYAGSDSFRFRKNRVYAYAYFQKKHIRLELCVGENKVHDPDFRYWRQGASDWGYTYIYPSAAIPEKVKNWIELARKFRGEGLTENDEIED